MYNPTRWGYNLPETVELLGQLYDDGRRCGIISGAVAVEHGAREETGDTDIFTHRADFGYVAELLPDPTIALEKEVQIVDYMGRIITFKVNELNATLDNRPVQVIQPLSDVVIDGRRYDLSHTNLVAGRLMPWAIRGRKFWTTHIFDSIAMKILFQRVKGKHDIPDLIGLAKQCPVNDPYISQRSEQIGFIDRERNWLGRLGLGVESRTYLDLAVAHYGLQ